MKLIERLEEIEDQIFATQSAYDIVNLLKNKSKPYRFIFDINNRTYFIGDAMNYVHTNLLEVAYDSGFYPELKYAGEIPDYIFDCLDNEEMLFAIFYPSESKEIDIERSSDGYPIKYIYDFGTIYTSFCSPLEEFDIFNLLKNPIKKEILEESTPFKILNERLEHYLK